MMKEGTTSKVKIRMIQTKTEYTLKVQFEKGYTFLGLNFFSRVNVLSAGSIFIQQLNCCLKHKSQQMFKNTLIYSTRNTNY